MTDAEEYTPSLVAGLIRYRVRVLAVVAACALLGVVYGLSSWQPEATMSVVVQVSSGLGNTNNVDPDRATSEVAAQLGSPQVISAVESKSGVTIDNVTATATQGKSTITVVVAAGSASAATAGANALIPAYDEIRTAQEADQIQAKLAVIDASIADIDNSVNLINTQLGGLAATSAEAAALRAELDTLSTRRNQLRADRDAAQIAASSPSVAVSVGDGPNPGPGRMSLIARYVPAGVVVGLLLSLVVVAVVERRRPWLVDAESASRLMGAPLVGVGRSTAIDNDVAPVVAMSILRALGDAPLGVVLLVPRGGPTVGEGTVLLTDQMTPVFERAGAQATVLSVAPSGRVYLREPGGAEQELSGMWKDFIGRAELETGLRSAGIDSDVVVIVPASEVDHEVLLDLILLSDAVFMSTETGTDLDPLFALRRDFDALGRSLDGVVVDLPVPSRA